MHGLVCLCTPVQSCAHFMMISTAVFIKFSCVQAQFSNNYFANAGTANRERERVKEKDFTFQDFLCIVKQRFQNNLVCK